jgi:hypothetical protein
MYFLQLTDNGDVIQEILSNVNIEWDSSHFCTANALTVEESAYFRIFPLIIVESPEINSVVKKAVRDGCEQVGGLWKQRWKIIELYETQAERDEVIAADVEAKRLASIPMTVTMRQARLALLQSGHYATVVDYITGMTGDAGIAARVTWEYSTTVERYMPLTIQLKGILGLTDLETDELYLLANTL